MQNVQIDKIIRSKRKTFALQVGHDASLTVRAPLNAPLALIEKIVIKKSGWIRKKQKELTERRQTPKAFSECEEFLFLGGQYSLCLVDGQDQPLVFDKNFFLARRYAASAREIFVEWYKRAAFAKITERANYYAKEACLKFSAIKVNNAQKRWGSCSSRGNLNFTWRLIMAPQIVIDYVVVHELAHLKHRDHSPKFWEYVKLLMPEYKKERQWLKDNGHLLNI